MSLSHEFAVIRKNTNENFIDASMNPVSIPDAIVLYMNDSFQWVDTWWNGNKEGKGLSYYGYTIIKSENVGKLNQIISTWIALFEIAPDDFFLTGNYLPEEDKYEKSLFNKQNVLLQLKDLSAICVEAIKQKKCILHNGI